jgi:CRISPR-associated protein Cmr2
MPNQHLFLFTVGPVQSFIAQARKTQDLYAGSKILSVLINHAMDCLSSDKEKTVDFVFPHEEAESKPNRFTAIVTLKEGGDMQKVGEEVQTAILDYFVETLGKEVIYLYKNAEAQLKDFLKIYWLAAEYDENKDYGTQIKRAEKYLAASKNIRYFDQFEEVGRKCSLNGDYNVKFYRKTLEERDATANTKLKATKLFNENVCILDFEFKHNGKHKDISYKHIQAGEGLCAVSMLKRFFKDEDEFPSTSEIATMATLNQLRANEDVFFCKDENNKNTDTCFSVKSSIELLLKYNSQFLYKEAITSTNIKKVLEEDGQKCNLDLISCWQEKVSQAAKNKNLTLSKHYAILLFDADGMGKKIGSCKNAEEVRTLSTALANYGKWATDFINSNKYGKTVYAGGDDFLGFMNLNHLFPALEEMRKQFDTQVNANKPEHLQLSFSAGIAVAHYKTPLSEVLNYARLMEKKAKAVQKIDESKKKDAFAIAVLKHSGEIHDTVWRFRDQKGESAVWATSTINALIHHLRNKEVSDKFMTNLADEFAPMLNKKGTWGQEDSSTNTDNNTAEALDAILKFELTRFMKRADAHINADFSPLDFANKLYTLYKEHTKFDLSVQNFINLLFISEFISRDINKTTANEPSLQN